MKASDFKDFLKKAKKVVPTKSNVEFLQTIFINSGWMTVRNEVGQYRSKIEGLNKDVAVCVYFSDFEKLMDKLKDLEVEFKHKDTRFEVITSKGKFVLPIYDLEDKKNSPFMLLDGDATPVCDFTAWDSQEIIKAVKYVASDTMRPVYETVLIEGGYIVANDGVYLKFQQRQEELEHEPFMMAKAMVGLMDVKGYSVSLVKEIKGCNQDTAVCLVDEEQNELIWIMESGRYPEWRRVIPLYDSAETTLVLDSATLLETIDFAKGTEARVMKFDIRAELEGCVTLSSRKQECGKEYSRTIEADATGKDIVIGFMLEKLENIIKTEKVKSLNMEFTDPTRCMKINENLILMPVML